MSACFSDTPFDMQKPDAHERYPSFSGWNTQGMPLVRTAVTAGDHIDWITVSPDDIRLTLSLKPFQNARNWRAFLASVRTFIVMSISAFVMLPLSGYLCFPVAPTTIAASMMPI